MNQNTMTREMNGQSRVGRIFRTGGNKLFDWLCALGEHPLETQVAFWQIGFGGYIALPDPLVSSTMPINYENDNE